MADVTDTWDPRWLTWFAESDARQKQREIALNGRESFGETQWPPGVGIEFGIFAGAICPIILTPKKRIGAPKPRPGECTCRPPCVEGIPIPIRGHEVSNMTEKQTPRAAGVPGILSFGKTSPFPDHRPDS